MINRKKWRLCQVRVSCAEQLLAMCGWGGGDGARAALIALVGTGGAVRGAVWGARLQRHARNAQQFLQLLCRLVSLAGPTARILEDLAEEVCIFSCQTIKNSQGNSYSVTVHFTGP